MTDIEDYDVSVRSITPDYGPVLPHQLKRDTASEGELRLKSVAVELKLAWKPDSGSDRNSAYYKVTYSVDHDDGTITATGVGDAHSEVGALSCQRLAVVFAVGDQVADQFVTERELDLDVIPRSEHLVSASMRDDEIAVHGRQGAADD